MNTGNLAFVFGVLFLTVVITGCGPDTAAQLEQTRTELAAASEQVSSLKADLARERMALDKLTQERDQALNDLRFFAKKAEPLEAENEEKTKALAALDQELGQCRKAEQEKTQAADTLKQQLEQCRTALADETKKRDQAVTSLEQCRKALEEMRAAAEKATRPEPSAGETTAGTTQ